MRNSTWQQSHQHVILFCLLVALFIGAVIVLHSVPSVLEIVGQVPTVAGHEHGLGNG